MDILTHDPKLLKEIAVKDCQEDMQGLKRRQARAKAAYLLADGFVKFAKTDKVAIAEIEEIQGLYKLCPEAEGQYTGQWFTNELKDGAEPEFLCGKEGETKTNKKAYDAKMKAAATKLLKRFITKQRLQLVSLSAGSEDKGYYEDDPETSATIKIKGTEYDLRVFAFSAGGFFYVSEPEVFDPYVEVGLDLTSEKYQSSGWNVEVLKSCVESTLKKKWIAACPKREFPKYWVTADEDQKNVDQVESEFVKALERHTTGQSVR